MPINQGLPPVGFKMGDDARILKELDGPKTIWKAGSVVEIQWTMAANHGGGYCDMCRQPRWRVGCGRQTKSHLL